MTTELLRYINLKLSELLPYEYYEWSKKVVYPYWIGEYSETSPTSEDGYREDTLMITGTTKGSVMDLEKGKERKFLKRHFRNSQVITLFLIPGHTFLCSMIQQRLFLQMGMTLKGCK